MSELPCLGQGKSSSARGIPGPKAPSTLKMCRMTGPEDPRPTQGPSTPVLTVLPPRPQCLDSGTTLSPHFTDELYKM